MNRQKLAIVVGLLVTVLLLAMPLYLTSSYYLGRVAEIFITCIFTLGLWIIMSIGEVSFAHAGFMLIGAYTVALLTVRTGTSFWLALPAAGLISVIVAFFTGFAGLRRVRGVYFFIYSLALGESIRLIALYWKGLTGGINGIFPVPRPELFGIDFTGPAFYYLCLGILFITFGVMYGIWRSRVGDILRGVRDNEKLASASGIPVFRYRMMAWLICCFFAGISGGLLASFIGFTAPNEFVILRGVTAIIHIVVGGQASPFGPLIGTGFMMLISTLIKDISGAPYWIEPLMYGTVLIIALLGMRSGIWEFLIKVLKREGVVAGK